MPRSGSSGLSGARSLSRSDPGPAVAVVAPKRPSPEHASLSCTGVSSRWAQRVAPSSLQMTGQHRSDQADWPLMPYRVLVVEDEIGIRVGLEASLRIAGCQVSTAADGEAATSLASEGGFDVIVLDLILPLKDGLAVCEELRAKDVTTPIVMLTARTQVEDRLQGFAAGADDYLTKPFEVMELLARIRAVMRRSQTAEGALAPQVFEFGDVRVDTASSAVWRGDERLRLSMMEYALLQYLVRHPSEVLDRRRILDEVWNSDPEVGPRTVDVHVAWLRKKIGDEKDGHRWIRTVHGKGYSFVPE